MFSRNENKNETGKMTCIQNGIKCDLEEQSELIKCKKNYSAFIHEDPWRCGKKLKNISNLQRFLFPFLFTVCAVVVSWLVYQNGIMKSELIEYNYKLNCIQENFEKLNQKLLKLTCAPGQSNLEIQSKNDEVTEDTQLHEVSGEGSNDDLTLPQDLFSEFVDRLNLTEYIVNIIQKGNVENITELQVLLNGLQANGSTIPLNKYLCDLLPSLDAPNLSEYTTQCDELAAQGRRTKRSNTRGKQNGRKSSGQRGRHHKSPNSRGPVASHFKGGIPETFIRDGGLVAPWFHDSKASADLGLKYEFREGRGTVEVVEEGLYMIYAQVFYLTREVINSFTINVREKESSGKPVAYCSVNAMVSDGGVTEVSCYTAVIRYLNATNQVYLMQRDRNRRMILREGHTFLGIIRLNSAPEPKRRRGNRN